MCALWGVSKSAVNTGYGMDFPVFTNGIAVHPEFTMSGPYGNPRTVFASRGGASIGSLLSRIPDGRTLRRASGRGSYTNAALKGCGSYNKAALKGCGKSYTKAAIRGFGGGSSYDYAALNGMGWEETIEKIMNALGGSAMQVIQRIADKMGTKVIDLLQDPDKLLAVLKQVAPKVWSVVKKIYEKFTGRKDKKGKLTKEEQQYLSYLKDTNPQMYEKERKRIMKKYIDEYEQSFYSDDNPPPLPPRPRERKPKHPPRDNYDVIDTPRRKPRRKVTKRRPIEDDYMEYM